MPRWNLRFHWIWIGTLALMLTIFLSVTAYGSLARVPAGVRVASWPIGGLSWSELEHQLAAKTSALLEQKVRLTVPGGGSAERTLRQLGLEINGQELLAQLQPVREGPPYQRAAARWRLRGASLALTPALSADKLRAALSEAFPQVYARKPTDAKRLVDANDVIRYEPEARVERVNEAQLLSRLQAALPDWGAVAAAPESAGGSRQQEPAAIWLDVPMRTQEPAITEQALRAQGIVRKIGEFTTVSPPAPSAAVSVEGRVHNVRSTAASLQDVLLKPGEVFDYAPFIERTERRFGFKEAPVIVNGKLVPGIGGGICQVSSTLYNAVLRAGLAVVERRNHSLPVSYVALGQDATFATGHINFKFRNSTNHYLLIRTSSDERSVTVKLFGQTPPDITYEIESKTLETLAPPVKYVLNPTLPSGKQEIVMQGKPGYVVETFRFKKQNGVVISQEKVSRDTYHAQPTVVASGGGSGTLDRTAPPPGGSPAPLIEDGVRGPTFR
ncbi:Vancomycin resistance protein YoaR, contains peptidoglycan-binding and VanW domains [Paenibacillus tianmuensis]|uniref:Vancomycin resistance protein YoaR, contains peptidoglycan-binding and VanW domains n=1 Tax=Paenibacillus tianmuensis TaxID=624147 RepID=A0A1G4SMM1_9BACL|nr:VanW family protein [Paenibacillus tianmuensis]SCW70484.1 Vancomycin resistance protein YoaR, contains peptidoglycan-binding and VanW domains [Paenibacillus tianmuensis]